MYEQAAVVPADMQQWANENIEWICANPSDFAIRFTRPVKMGVFALLSSWIDAATNPTYRKKQ